MACTPEDVRTITGSTADDPTIDAYIQAAQCIFERVTYCTSVKGISDACFDQACAWLTAHLMAISAPQQGSSPNKKETFENYSVDRLINEFDGKGVLGTTYGMAANGMLGGCLQEVDKAPMQVAYFG